MGTADRSKPGSDLVQRVQHLGPRGPCRNSPHTPHLRKRSKLSAIAGAQGRLECPEWGRRGTSRPFGPSLRPSRQTLPVSGCKRTVPIRHRASMTSRHLRCNVRLEFPNNRDEYCSSPWATEIHRNMARTSQCRLLRRPMRATMVQTKIAKATRRILKNERNQNSLAKNIQMAHPNAQPDH